jgi:outer membrane protein assembly factor BamB
MRTDQYLYILSKGRVAAINKKDGSILWEIKLKEYANVSSTSMGYGQISVENNKLYIGISGLLFCLSAKDGSLIWFNELKGWGYNFISIAGAGNESAVAASAATQAAVTTTVATTAT